VQGEDLRLDVVLRAGLFDQASRDRAAW
jgi:hypothetical protein